MLAKVPAQNSMVHIRRGLLLWSVALAVLWGPAAGAGREEDLIAAATRGDVAAVEALLANGAEVNAKSKDDKTALMAASMHGHYEVVQALLGRGAEANARLHNGTTALMMASFNGYREVVQALLDKGAEVNAKTSIGVTALMLASQNGHREVVQALLDKGAEVNAKASNGKTALDAAMAQRHPDVIALLAQARSKPFVARPPGALVGRWHSVETSTGGIGGVYVFHEDGSVDFSMGAVAEMSYRLNGDDLYLPADGQKQKVKFVDDNRVEVSAEQDGKTHTQELKRKEPFLDPKNLILGEWTTPREDLRPGVEATEIFQAAGKYLLVIPFACLHGQYVVDGDTIRIEMPKVPTIQGPFKVEGDTLTIPGARSGTSQFVRY